MKTGPRRILGVPQGIRLADRRSGIAYVAVMITDVVIMKLALTLGLRIDHYSRRCQMPDGRVGDT
ncbi:MAG: hypothetical protein ABR986_03650 [Methanomassiliicoccales archaeon]|jgi:hypothetical protein